jgi:hypothetical protein
MRARFLIFIILVLFAAPARLRAQLPSAIVHEPPCAVAADDTWTDAEIFVWKKICAGDIADFNADPKNGGDLDPRSGAELPGSRVLRNSFITAILLDEKYRGAIKHYGVRITGARFAEKINFQNAELQHELWFERCLFEKGVDLSWVQAKRAVGFNASKARESLTFYAAQFAADLWVTDSTLTDVVLAGAHVGRTLKLSKSSASEGLDMTGIDVGSDLFLDNARLTELNLLGAHVAHNLALGRSEIGDLLDMDNLQVGVDLDMHDGTFDRIYLANAQIGGQLYWGGARFFATVDLTGASVGGALDLSATTWWGDPARLIARHAKIGVIPSLSRGWPAVLEIDGLTYRDIGEDGDNFVDWLDSRLPRYSYQPYEQLAGVLHAQGNNEAATEVRYAARDRERREKTGPFVIWLTLLDWLIGYGYYPYLAGIWAVGLVIAGAIVLRASGEGPRNAMPIGISYSFDTLLPIVRLRERHYQIDLRGWVRYYFYWHKLMGWVLASFLAGGLSGLTK